MAELDGLRGQLESCRSSGTDSEVRKINGGMWERKKEERREGGREGGRKKGREEGREGGREGGSKQKEGRKKGRKEGRTIRRAGQVIRSVEGRINRWRREITLECAESRREY